mmetsp:Transcript_25331/g.59296  ORF Transcript_25331/g.59296 Transcript_25331/m.59296 type:complete len:459 (+) Transcript_25331:208-1584(+)|eukprot:CAMPEP_0197195408 /NCGR_PEP_ID=MMETSP1423-20130617/31057_1 /TAXON_ID=476441 /ORGANISM="Pseudo-nitzschia heimii, Strain UNC1101" /LENGTH=458 /DNA_ID=CAMNT_0042649037 /DNA_START=164 /DNA_END=1540 /DNA_ORIENTATION=+
MSGVGLEGKKSSSCSPVSNPNLTGNSSTAEELFSPTSAAAWALSTLHNFGAAAPNDNGSRPSTDSLIGTRLFNNSSVASNDSTKILSATSEQNLTHTENCVLPAAHPHAVSGVTWGQTEIQHRNTSNLVDPSPLGVRTHDCQAARSVVHSKPLARTIPSTSMVTPTPKKLKSEGSAVSTTYSRKKKSLGVLAENFLNHYKKLPCGSVIIVDHAAVDLGVERRRIYDVVNILESVSLVTKKQKNTYSWMGMDHLDDMFGDLQAKAILDYPDDAREHLDKTISVKSTNDEGKLSDNSKTPRKHSKGKENKSLAKLSQEFLQVFLVGFETLSLPEASDKIQGTTSMEELIAMGGGARVKSTADGDIPDARELKAAAARGLKTKIRRLYDIANVFLSVGLLRKVENMDTSRRPNFAWNYQLSAKEIYIRYKNKSSELKPVPGDSRTISETLSSIAASVRNQG